MKKIKSNASLAPSMLNTTAAIVSVALLCVAFFAPVASAQTLQMQFGFEDSGTTSTDSVASVSLDLVNGANTPTDFHGAIGTGVAGVGKALDFSSATAGNGNNPLASTANNSTINFGTISSFTVAMWIKPTGAINFARWFCLAANGVTDNGAVNSLGFQGNNNFTSSQNSVNTVNTTANGISIPQNQWTFIAYTYDGANITIYTASETAAVGAGVSVANAGGSVNIGSAFSMWIGNRLSNRQRGFPAYFDDVRFYTGAADAAFLENVRKQALPDPFVLGTTIVPSTAIVGNPVSVSASVSGTLPIAYTWMHVNGAVTNLIPAASPSLNIPSVTLADAGSYSLIVSNNPGGIPTVRTNTGATLTVRTSANPLTWIGGVSSSWDTTTANWTNPAAGGGLVPYTAADNVTFDDSGLTNTISLSSATLFPSSVSVSSSSNYTFGGAGALSGGMTLTKSGTGLLVVNNANTFSGNVIINGGILRAGNGSALGTTNGNTTVASGGTFDVNGQGLGSEEFVVQGAGLGGTNGAIANTGGQQQSAISRMVLSGDATFNATGQRWDVYGASGTGYFKGNGHALTKIGGQEIWLKDVGDTGLGDIRVMQSTLGFQGLIGMGNPAGTISVSSAGLGFWATTPTNNLDKIVILTNSTFSSGGGPNDFHGPISMYGTNTISAGTDFHLYNGISGSGGFIKTGAGILTIDGANSYTGSTFVNAGQLILTAGSGIDSSSAIRISPLVILDASAVPTGLNRTSGQSLLGLGNSANTAYVTGNVTATGATVAPGVSGPGTLTIAGALSLDNCTLPINLGGDPSQLGNGVNDYINVFLGLTLSGVNTIQITPVAPLAGGTYTILTYSGGLSGGLANLALSSANPRYTIELVDPTTTPGSIQVTVTGNPTPLVWRGGKLPGPNVWDHNVTNWFNTGTSLFDRFYNGDIATFDDSGTTNRINVTETNIPGLLTFANNSLNYRFEGNGTISGLMGKDGSGTVTLALSNAPGFTFITNNAGSLVFDLPISNATISAVISGNGGGQGRLVQASTNTLTLSGDNSTYNGSILVNNGMLRYTSIASLGGFGEIFVTNGTGSLNLGNTVAVTTGSKNIHIKGAGLDGQGAILGGAGGGPVPMMTGTLTLDGDATIAANPRWDFAAGSTLNANGYTLTKTGTADLWLITANNATMGDVHIVQGVLGFQQGTSMGDPAKTITVESNSTCGLWDNQATFLDKHIVLNNGGAISSGGNTNTLLGTITLVQNNNLNANADLFLNGPIDGSGGFTKGGGSTLYLNGANTYSGQTVIGANSAVVVGPGSSLGTSSLVEIDGGSTLNVSNLASFTFGAGQTLIGNGTLRGGNVIFGSGSTLSVGFAGSTYTLNAVGTLTLQAGSTNVVDVNKTTSVANDRVVGPTLVTMGGTLVVNNIGSALAGGDAIQLFSATNYGGTLPNIIPSSPGFGLQWDTSTLLSDGTLRVVGVAVPQIGTTTVSGGNFVFSGGGGTAGAAYSILYQTNLAEPLINWILIGSGNFDGSGNFAFTNGATAGTVNKFYILRTP